MKSSFYILTALLALATVCLADLADNQIDEEQDISSNFFGRYARPQARYTVKTCTPCAAENQCQVMGMQRFAEPRCEALGGLGAPCRPFQEADNKTLSFPPSTILHCNDVYMQFCPCASGLVCDPEEAECKRAAPQQTQQVEPTRRPQTSSQWPIITTRRPRWQQQQQPRIAPMARNTYQFVYAKPERYSEATSYALDTSNMDESFGESTGAADEEAPLVSLVPMQARQESWTVRRVPQWPWAVAGARFH